MPPKSKSQTGEWNQCLRCGVIISNRDLSKHKAECQADDEITHGHIKKDVFFGVASELRDGGFAMITVFHLLIVFDMIISFFCVITVYDSVIITIVSLSEYCATSKYRSVKKTVIRINVGPVYYEINRLTAFETLIFI